MDFTKKILPGDKLDISLTNAENDAVYKSMFSDLISEKMWEITMPVSAGRIVLLQVGEPFSFILYTSDKVLLEGSAIVRKRYKKENLYFLVVELVNELKRIQRRDFFRMPCMINMRYSMLEYDENIYNSEVAFCDMIYKGTAEIEKSPWYDSVILDISGGGIRCSDNKPIELGSFLMVRFMLNVNDTDEVFDILGCVVNCEKSLDETRYFIRIRFIFEKIADREKIVRYVFEEERRIRRREME